MRLLSKFSPIARAIAVVGATGALVTGVTFAALNSTATLTGNSMSSATATLLVKNNDTNQGPAASVSGFAFTGLVPGGAFSPAQHFALTNLGNVDLDVTVYATSVAATGTGTLDKNKVIVRFTNNNPTDTVDYTLAQLESAVRNVPGSGGAGSTLPDTETENFDIQIRLDNGAVSGSGPVSVNGFDFVFTGTNEAEVL